MELNIVSHGNMVASFIKPSLGDDQLHTHINPHVLKLLHERAGLTANFMADVYESPDWTVFPTVSSTESKSSLVGMPIRSPVFA
jgi:hypothetical protein